MSMSQESGLSKEMFYLKEEEKKENLICKNLFCLRKIVVVVDPQRRSL